MAKSENAMDVYRREQKKKELKKHQAQRQKEKQAKLSELDADEIQARIKKLDRQIQQNPVDGPTRKRKQELEDTLKAVLKKQKTMEEESSAQAAGSRGAMTLSDIEAANRERYQNPENSVYYHPVLNPFGAPPPGQPQRYKVAPPTQTRQQPQEPRRSHAPTPSVRPPTTGRLPSQRPGKRPPLPPGPPPPGTIQVPSRPPLPQREDAAQVQRPVPPPPSTNIPPPPPPPPPAVMAFQPPPPAPTTVQPPSVTPYEVEVSQADNVVAAYPPPDSDEDDEDRVMNQVRVRSLVPMTLRANRPKESTAIASRPLAQAPRPPPPTSAAPGPVLNLIPRNAAPSTASAAAVATPREEPDFDAFMQEIKQLEAMK